MSLSDTTGGKMFFSVGGTVVTHVGGSAVAVNYRATSGKLAFQLLGRYAPSGSTLQRVERSEEHTSELQSQSNLVCRLLLEKKKRLTTTCSRPVRCIDRQRTSHPKTS